jgi:hypothetical protein
MITPSFGLTATERVLPKLALDFTTALLDPRVTFARAGNTATRINSNGLIEVVNADLPRFDYDPITLACRGLLVEELRANLAVYSEEFILGSGWGLTNANRVVAAVSAPNGAASVIKLEETAVSGVHTAGTNIGAVAVGAVYTASIFAKAAERTLIWITANAEPFRYFNLANGTAASPSNSTIVDLGDGWYRCTTTFTKTNTNGNFNFGTATSTATPVHLGVAGSGVYLFGAQIEAGAFGTSYIPTEATAVTRNADVAAMTGTNFSDWWQAGRGGVLVRALPSTVSGTRPLIQFDDNTADNIIALRGNTTNPELYIKATTDQATIDAGTIAANTAYRLAGTWATDNCAANLNGGVPVLDTSATIPTATQMRLGSDGTNYLNGHLQSIEYYNERILNSNLQVVSSPAGYRSIIGPVLRDSIIT